MSAAAKATGGAAVGILATALVAGSIFWARQIETEVREGFKSVRVELQELNWNMMARLDPVIEFRGSASTHIEVLNRRIDKLESEASAR